MTQYCHRQREVPYISFYTGILSFQFIKCVLSHSSTFIRKYNVAISKNVQRSYCLISANEISIYISFLLERDGDGFQSVDREESRINLFWGAFFSDAKYIPIPSLLNSIKKNKI